ncbi:MAG: glycosyltransferase family 4 protein [Pseudomonadota bacterium]
MLRILTVSSLYPSAARPHHGVFVETRMRRFRETTGAYVRVIAPVPWFPFKSSTFGEYAQFARTPRRETRNGFDVDHPRYLLPPKIGMEIAPAAMARAFIRDAERIVAEDGPFDLIDAHYYYPDGVAAASLATRLGLPFVVTARGTDINLVPGFDRPRRRILETAEAAAASITVCAALKDEMVALGAAPDKIHVLRNGVDLDLFHPPSERTAGPLKKLVSVGHLIERKGHHLVIEALADLPGCELEIAGDGPEKAALERLAAERGVADRVTFLGRLSQSDLPAVYGRADALVLASSREGWANVLLEAMACGTPVVATPIWGTPEVVASPAAGRLTEDRSATAVAAAVTTLFEGPPSRDDTRAYAERFSWDETVERMDALFRRVARR